MRDGEENAPVQVNPCRRLFLGFGLALIFVVRGAITTCAFTLGRLFSYLMRSREARPDTPLRSRRVARDISEHRSFSTRSQLSSCSPLPRPFRVGAGQTALADAPADDQPLFCLRGGQPINPGTVSQTFHALVPQSYTWRFRRASHLRACTIFVIPSPSARSRGGTGSASIRRRGSLRSRPSWVTSTSIPPPCI